MSFCVSFDYLNVCFVDLNLPEVEVGVFYLFSRPFIGVYVFMAYSWSF